MSNDNSGNNNGNGTKNGSQNGNVNSGYQPNKNAENKNFGQGPKTPGSVSANMAKGSSSQDPGQNDYSKPGMITFCLSMGVSILFLIYVAFLSGGIDLKEVSPTGGKLIPGQTQAAAAEAPIDVASVKDPWVSSDEMIKAGHQLFVQNCQMCHGAKGLGDGPAGASLNPKPRNMVEGKWKYGGTRLGLMGVLEKGSPGTSMQSYKAALKVNQRWALVHFVRSITQNKVPDDDAEVAKKAPSLQ